MISNWDVFTLLCELLSDDINQQSVERANQHDCWNDLIQQSSEQFVICSLYWRLSQNTQLWPLVPEEIREYLRQIFDLNVERNSKLDDQAKEAIRILNAVGVAPMLYKGTGRLVSRSLPHIGYRMQMDIDLLVPPKDLDIASEALIEFGYVFAEEKKVDGEKALVPVTENSRIATLEVYEHHQHLPPMLLEGAAASLELHRHCYGKRFQTKRPLEEIFSRATQINQDGLNYLLMSQADQLDLLILHSYLNDGYKHSAYMPLRVVMDYLSLLKLHSREVEINMPDTLKNDYNQKFFHQLVFAIFHSKESYRLSKGLKAYLAWMRLSYNHVVIGRMTYWYGLLVRKTISLWQQPSLLIYRLKGFLNQ